MQGIAKNFTLLRYKTIRIEKTGCPKFASSKSRYVPCWGVPGVGIICKAKPFYFNRVPNFIILKN